MAAQTNDSEGVADPLLAGEETSSAWRELQKDVVAARAKRARKKKVERGPEGPPSVFWLWLLFLLALFICRCFFLVSFALLRALMALSAVRLALFATILLAATFTSIATTFGAAGRSAGSKSSNDWAPAA